MSEGMLSGLKVVELGEFIAAPYCTKMMADLGAEVVKLEKPGQGDEARRFGPFPKDSPRSEHSGLFLLLNTNKMGVTLDPQTPTGKEILRGLLRDADVFVESHPPGAMERLGLGFQALRTSNPRLVVTSITPYGQDGPYRDYKGYSINCAAVGGATKTTGNPDREPLPPPYFQGAYQAGLHALGATMAALMAREVTGRGQHVDISEAEIWATIYMGANALFYFYEGRKETVRGRLRGGSYPSGHYRCKDGYVSMSAPQVAQWIRFLAIMGTPEWTKNPRYRNRRAMGEEYPEEVDALLEPWLMSHTKREIYDLCREKRVPFVPIHDIADIVNEPHLKEREYYQEMQREDLGTLKMPGFPWNFTRGPGRLRSSAPRLGQHNEEVYCGRLGFSRGDLASLAQCGVV